MHCKGLAVLFFVFFLTVFGGCEVLAEMGDYCIESNTVSNGCAFLPITWTLSGTDSKTEISGNVYVFSVYRNRECVFVSNETDEEKFVYTPQCGGEYRVRVEVKNQFGACSAESEEIRVSEKLYMGIYEQDMEALTADAIEWQVLYADEEKALLVSKYILETGAYFNPSWIKYKYCNWGGSIIGMVKVNYLGNTDGKLVYVTETTVPMKDGSYGTDEDLFGAHARNWCENTFYASAFSDEEKERILFTENINEDSPDGVDGGENTLDHVFFLSYSEVLKYMPQKADRVTENTLTAQTKLKSDSSVYWWLRTNGKFRCNAMYVYAASGAISAYGSDVGHESLGYRPAMWIKVGS